MTDSGTSTTATIRQRKNRDAERKRAKRAADKLVVIPKCENLARRAANEENDIAWLMYYFGEDSEVRDCFWYEFTSQQRQMIEGFQQAILVGGDQAFAASRGEGKTTILERMILKYTLQGVLPYSVLFQATGTLADNSLDTIKSAMEENPLLCADYPEVCVPVRALENTPSLAHYQIVSGFRHDNGEPFEMASSYFTWCGQEIIFPRVPGSPSAGSIVATRGLDSAVRGLKKRGRRPRLAAIDDPDTEDTARSEDQSRKLEDRIDRAIGGLGDQQNPVARIFLGTIQSRISAAYKFTDPEQKPSWHGKRFKFLVKEPDNPQLWGEYVLLKQKDWQNKTNESHELYVKHRDVMDAGAEVANPNRYAQGELSALQHYYNQVARLGQDAVNTEYQNDPPEEEGREQLALTAYHIQTNCLSGLEKRRVPEGTVAITRGGDVRKLGLDYVTIASDEHGSICVIDYDFYEFRTEGKKAADCEKLILEGLFDWYEAMLEHPYIAHDGEELFSDLSLIDMGWKEESWNIQPVQTFCSQVGYSKFMPSKGMSPYYQPQPSKHIVLGDNWHWDERKATVFMNADHWKLKVHEGFLADRGEPGAISIFDPPSIDGRPNRTAHLSFAKHILSETWETRFVPGFKGARTGWWKSPKPNHKFDALYQAIVGRSMQGISVLSVPNEIEIPKQDKPRSQSPPPAPPANYSRPRW